MKYIIFFLMLCSCVSRDTIGPYVMRIQKNDNGDLEQQRCLIYIEYGAFTSISLHQGPCTKEAIK
jgi:hypothetical protein